MNKKIKVKTATQLFREAMTPPRPARVKVSKKKAPKPLARGGPVRKVSRAPHKVARRKLYQANRDEYMALHPLCECGCGRPSDDLHHKARRHGKNYHDKTTFMAVARVCHDWIHAHPAEARAKGWLV